VQHTAPITTLFTEFTDATNDVAADGISEHRLTPILAHYPELRHTSEKWDNWFSCILEHTKSHSALLGG